jgi:DUF971 family protein
MPFELMRVYSPSAEVQGHGPGQEVLQTGKREVGIVEIEPVGNYAVQPRFSDGHDTGIFSWDYLYFLGPAGGAVGRYERVWQPPVSTATRPWCRRPGQCLRQPLNRVGAA